MSSAEQAQQEIIEEFGLFDGWMDRYQYLIDLGRQLPPLTPEQMVDENLLQGCQSRVWLIPSLRRNTLHFAANSDAAIVSGLIALLLRIYSDRPPAEILATEPHFVQDLGLTEHLSPTRSNGLHAMLNRIREAAVAARTVD